MSEQPETPQQPPAPEPSFPAPPPPSSATLTGPEPPGAPKPKPKKRSTGCVVGGVVLALLLICGCIAAAAAALIYFGSPNTKAIVERADKQYEEALTSFESLEPVFKLIGDMQPEQVQAALRNMDLNATINGALAKLDGAEEEIDKLSDSASDVKTPYKASLSAARAALGDLRKMGSILGQLSGTTKYLASVKTKVESANAKMEDAISEANDRDYLRSKTLAQEAARLYGQAETTLRAEHRKNPDLELDRAADVVEEKMELAEIAIDMAGYGGRGQRSSYNREADRFNDQNNNLKSMYVPPVLKDPTLLAKELTQVYASFTKNVAKAEKKRKEALAALED